MKYHEDKNLIYKISSKGEIVSDLSGFLNHKNSKWNIQAITDCGCARQILPECKML